ncbi:beta-ketoacyl synthase N-terminal-like domain-containing protein [Haloferula sp. A504]|uniref:beta-ketoacyl synthase N-terminal-like domain-containing protein n=1 Tax=Haloferula sp. A504 TaxID=3373601 RepID=UPI0031BF0C65|nr:hypothetical protein [Verrucomicrobiaceae bacterium E54]
MNDAPAITGLGVLGALGSDLESHRAALAEGAQVLRPLSEMKGGPEGFGHHIAGWIESRERLNDRKWSPLSMAAIHVAAEALALANWSDAERSDAVVFFGTSRGSLAGWTEPWPERRDFDLLAATNSLPAEPAAAVSTTFGIAGPWQVCSTGCCAGLDALALADLWIRTGKTARALVVAVDLPLVTPVLTAYARTGLLTDDPRQGMIPAEAAAAVCLEPAGSDGRTRLLGCHAIADATALVGSGRDAARLASLLREASEIHGKPDLLIPHASGTASNHRLESMAIEDSLTCPVARYKPHTGHGVGAGGLLELALACAGIFPRDCGEASPRSIFKLASALGGRHSLACISR